MLRVELNVYYLDDYSKLKKDSDIVYLEDNLATRVKLASEYCNHEKGITLSHYTDFIIGKTNELIHTHSRQSYVKLVHVKVLSEEDYQAQIESELSYLSMLYQEEQKATKTKHTKVPEDTPLVEVLVKTHIFDDKGVVSENSKTWEMQDTVENRIELLEEYGFNKGKRLPSEEMRKFVAGERFIRREEEKDGLLTMYRIFIKTKKGN